MPTIAEQFLSVLVPWSSHLAISSRLRWPFCSSGEPHGAPKGPGSFSSASNSCYSDPHRWKVNAGSPSPHCRRRCSTALTFDRLGWSGSPQSINKPCSYSLDRFSRKDMIVNFESLCILTFLSEGVWLEAHLCACAFLFVSIKSRV